MEIYLFLVPFFPNKCSLPVSIIEQFMTPPIRVVLIRFLETIFETKFLETLSTQRIEKPETPVDSTTVLYYRKNKKNKIKIKINI